MIAFIILILVCFIIGLGLADWRERKAYARLKARADEWLEAEKQRPQCALHVLFNDGTDIVSDPIPPYVSMGEFEFYPATSKEYAGKLANSIVSGDGILRIRGKRWPHSAIKSVEVVPASKTR